jgi:hypothetical protein
MSDMIKILFVAKESKMNSKGFTPIYMRVTANGQRFESSIARCVDFATWSQSAGKMIGNTKESKELNDFLNVLRSKAFDIQKQMIIHGQDFSMDQFVKRWKGVEDKPHMLLEIFQHHNDQVKALIGLFYARKSRPNAAGQIPIYLRVTIDGQRFQTATGRFVEIDKWSQAKECQLQKM